MLKHSFALILFLLSLPAAVAADGQKIPVPGLPILVALSPSSESLAYFDMDGPLRVVDTQTGLPRFDEWILERGFARSARQLCVSNDGAVVAFLDPDSRLHIFNLRDRSREILTNGTATFALSDDGRYLAVKDRDLNVSLVPATVKELIPLLKTGVEINSQALGRLTFMPGGVRWILDSPSGGERDRRLKFISINQATEMSGNEEVGIKELVRRQFGQVGLPYPSRVLEISSDRKMILSVGHSVAEVWDQTRPTSPLTFMNGRGFGPNRYDPIETATLSLDGSRFAVVYAHVTVVASSEDGETVKVLRNESRSEPRMSFGSVAARFTANGNQLVVARARSDHSLVRYGLQSECGEPIAQAGTK